MLAPATLRPSTPPEIWRVILRYATASETGYHADSDYHPFTSYPDPQETTSAVEREFCRLQTCTSLVRVSRLFRAIAVPFLYEDVRICDARDLESLLLGLLRSEREHGAEHYGTYVRRLEIPRRRSHRHFLQCETQRAIPTFPIALHPSAPSLADLLRLCPNLQILVRPCLRLDAEHIEFWAQLVAAPCTPRLSHLRRLDWHESELDLQFYGSNYVSRLCEILCCAPSLQSLFLYSDRPNEWVPFRHVLRSQMDVLEGPSFPALREIVLHDPQQLARRGWRVVYEDGSCVPILLEPPLPT
ncbi:hypothetical protein FB45DRAFT_1059850 [Roridomyces roridus]|uniref:F-box domain-containing protein n=1 Tax=Roridomyces roridus TaxID=1738132 RepID=A0AAD7BPL5_9AGAR|nr:hypothetical protein FB45DRAFT_1059850 [Roridomyces roridus]